MFQAVSRGAAATQKNQIKYADVAELADALDSGSSESDFIWVRVPSSAPNSIVRTQSNQGSYFFCTRDYFGVQISR